MDASGYFAAFFYVFIVFAGAFFSLNLFLAAILNVFTEMDKKIKAYELEQKNKERILHGVIKGIFNKYMPHTEGSQLKRKNSLKKKKSLTAGGILIQLHHSFNKHIKDEYSQSLQKKLTSKLSMTSESTKKTNIFSESQILVENRILERVERSKIRKFFL